MYRRSIQATLVMALTIALGDVTPAAAGESQSRSTVVNFSDLDLGKPAHASELYARIRTAARRVCTDNFGRSITVYSRAVRACVAETVAHAVQSIDHGALTQVHEGSSGVRVASR